MIVETLACLLIRNRTCFVCAYNLTTSAIKSTNWGTRRNGKKARRRKNGKVIKKSWASRPEPWCRSWSISNILWKVRGPEKSFAVDGSKWQLIRAQSWNNKFPSLFFVRLQIIKASLVHVGRLVPFFLPFPDLHAFRLHYHWDTKLWKCTNLRLGSLHIVDKIWSWVTWFTFSYSISQSAVDLLEI